MVGRLSVAFALVAAVCFGLQLQLADYAMARVARASGRPPAVTAALLTLLSGAVVLWTAVLLRGVPVAIGPFDLLPFLVAGIADPALARVFSYEGVDRVGPAVASAVLAGSPAVAAVLAVLVLGEVVVVGTGLGIACIVVGVGALQLTYRSTRVADADGQVDLLKRRLRDAAPVDLLYPVGGMVLIGSAFVVVKIGLRGTPDALLGTAVTQTAALAALVGIALRSSSVNRGAVVGDRLALVTLLGTGVVIAVAWFSMFQALQLGSVVTVLPLVSTYPLVVVVLSYLSARELPRSPAVVGATVVIVVGAALVRVS